MMSDFDGLREELLETDEDFRRLHEQHQQCERRLQRIQAQSLPSQEDELEEKRIKVQKLALKDQMEALLRSRSAARATA